MADNSMLDRLVETLKRDIAPAIDDEFLKTQAYMSSVVVSKLAQQLALESEHRAAAQADIAALLADLQILTIGIDVIAVTQSIAQLDEARDSAALSALIETLYAERERVGEAGFEALLGRIRQTLRADIDRRMVYSR